jgi:hypothetical protein
MKAPLLILMGVVMLVAGSGLAIMNNACKSTHHGWCAPVSDVRHLVKTRHSQSCTRRIAANIARLPELLCA